MQAKRAKILCSDTAVSGSASVPDASDIRWLGGSRYTQRSSHDQTFGKRGQSQLSTGKLAFQKGFDFFLGGMQRRHLLTFFNFIYLF